MSRTGHVVQHRPQSGLLADRIRARYGLAIDGHQRELLDRSAAEGGLGLDDAVERLVNNETCFFRHPAQLAVLASRLLPERLRASRGRPLRILSAGCASGAEPASVAILLREHLPAAARSARIVGIDVSATALAQARRGEYTEWQLRHLSSGLRRRWFGSGPTWLLRPEIRRAVTYHRTNLVSDDARFFDQFSWDVILCRNVLIHLTDEAGAALVARLCRALAPGGYLLTGPSDPVHGMTNEMLRIRAQNTLLFQRTEGRRRMRTSRRQPDPPDRGGSLPSSPRPRRTVPSPPSSTQDAPARREVDTVAMEHLVAERFEDALQCLQAEPTEQHALLRAVALLHLARLDEAAQACHEALAHDGAQAEGHHLLSTIDAARGDLAGAREHARIALYLDPGFALAHLHASRVLERCGDHGAACRHLQRATALLTAESENRVRLFGCGFDRDALAQLGRARLASLERR